MIEVKCVVQYKKFVLKDDAIIECEVGGPLCEIGLRPMDASRSHVISIQAPRDNLAGVNLGSIVNITISDA